MSINSRAMLVQLTIHRWLATKHDKSATAQVESANNAHESGRFNKQLIDKSALKEIARIASAAREYHYKTTLPWGDNGDRLLPSKLYMAYTQRLREFKAEYERAVEEFLQAYPQLVVNAQTRLGQLYDPSDYPPTSHLRDAFDIETSFSPVPDAADFRVDLTDEQVKKIRSEITSTANARQMKAQADIWARMKDAVTKIHERLSDPKAVFRDSLIENAEQLCDLVPCLNVAEDPSLDALCNMIRSKLLYPPQRLREDLVLREEVTACAASILDLIIIDKEALQNGTTG